MSDLGHGAATLAVKRAVAPNVGSPYIQVDE